VTAAAHKARVFTVPAGEPFLHRLAAAVLDGFPQRTPPDGPLALGDWTILLPTRRAVRALGDIFAELSGRDAVLLPQLRALGDIDEEEMLLGDPAPPSGAGPVPPAIAAVERLLILTDLVMKGSITLRDEASGPQQGPGGAVLSPAQAAGMARALITLLDMFDTEQIDLAGITSLVADEFAANWQRTLDFLQIITSELPAALEARGAVAPMVRRRLLLEAERRYLARRGDRFPVIAAGSTGSIPATAELLKTVARMPLGADVLPGLDGDLDSSSWDVLGASHPQYGLKTLLDHIEVARCDVAVLPGGKTPHAASARIQVLSEAMRPVETTDQWQHCATRISRSAARRAIEGLSLIEAPGVSEEAIAIAVLMREALEQPGFTVALVTPDRALARRVSVQLERWEIAVNDSAGTPLEHARAGTFFHLVAAAAVSRFAPTPLLELLKHPLCRLGLDASTTRHAARILELAALRGVRPAPGIDGIRSAFDDCRRLHREDARLHPALKRLTTDDFDRASDLIDRLDVAFEPFAGSVAAPAGAFAALLERHIAAAEAVARGADEEQSAALWRGDDGEALAGFLGAVLEAAAASPPLGAADYPAYLKSLMHGIAVRPRQPLHPRASIWGPLEARLQSAGRIILGGLNEGTWPQTVTIDPWLNRPMRHDLGLEPPERRLGLAAHDFVQAASANEVVLTRAKKVDGTPGVASRWLQRLKAVLSGLGVAGEIDRSDHWLAIVRRLQQPERSIVLEPPKPSPPIAARPRRLSVTRIETLLRNPYAIFASEILNLRPLDPVDQEVDAGLRGQLIHKVLHHFLDATALAWPADPLAVLIEIAHGVFRDEISRPAVAAFWWPRFERVAAWFVETEVARRRDVASRHGEIRGRLTFDAPGGPFTLSAVADRVDVMRGGGLKIYDYKTGAVPSKKQVIAHKRPQLTLEAAIAVAGGFDDLPAAPVLSLEYIQLTGGTEPGRAIDVSGADPVALAREALDRLKRLVAGYDDTSQPYIARRLEDAQKYRDPYDHLARIAEWSLHRPGSEQS